MSSSTHSYVATVVWERSADVVFTDNRYSRAHRWSFDGGIDVAASSSPSVVPLPFSDDAAIDPEEAFVASLSSCHMLFFLSHCARRGFVVDRYEDRPVGKMGKDSEGHVAMLTVALRPRIAYGGDRKPTDEDVVEMHHQSHLDCYIANSVKTQVHVEPPFA